MKDEELYSIKSRWQLARFAGEDSDDAGRVWDDTKIRILLRSWSDIPGLLDEIKRLKISSQDEIVNQQRVFELMLSEVQRQRDEVRGQLVAAKAEVKAAIDERDHSLDRRDSAERQRNALQQDIIAHARHAHEDWQALGDDSEIGRIHHGYFDVLRAMLTRPADYTFSIGAFITGWADHQPDAEDQNN